MKIQSLKSIISQTLSIGTLQVDELVRITEYEPLVMQAAKERADEMGCPIDWHIIIEALVQLIKISIDYRVIMNEISYHLSSLGSNYILDECEELEDFINSIIIDSNGCAWGEIANSMNSKYKDVGEYFKLLVTGEISLVEFYKNTTDIMVEIIKSEQSSLEIFPIATYCISNNMSINIYEINTDDNFVFAGTSVDDSVECEFVDDTFIYGDMEIPLSDCIRVIR